MGCLFSCGMACVVLLPGGGERPNRPRGKVLIKQTPGGASYQMLAFPPAVCEQMFGALLLNGMLAGAPPGKSHTVWPDILLEGQIKWQGRKKEKHKQSLSFSLC